MTPDLLPRLFGTLLKMRVPLAKISVYGEHSFLWATVIAIVNDGLCHTAENRLNDIQELG